jgi:hypothetical protein
VFGFVLGEKFIFENIKNYYINNMGESLYNTIIKKTLGNHYITEILGKLIYKKKIQNKRHGKLKQKRFYTFFTRAHGFLQP